MLLVLAWALAGCSTFAYRPDPERAAYLAGKDATYLAWRLEAVSAEELSRAAPVLEHVHAALEASSEEELDAALADSFSALVDRFADGRDGPLVKELLEAALEDVKVEAGDLFEEEPRKTALLVVGGVLDGIAYVNTVVGASGP